MSYGKFIVLYGINNLGKTYQAKRLVEYLASLGHKVEYLKYPLYQLEPIGPIISSYLREGNPFDLGIREVQILYTLNRLQFQQKLAKKLVEGTWVVAEDYVGTGLAWGGKENFDFLIVINSILLREDLAILFDGERFTSGIEDNHKHENDDQRILEVRENFLNLAVSNHWHIVKANQTKNKVFDEIKDILKRKKVLT